MEGGAITEGQRGRDCGQWLVAQPETESMYPPPQPQFFPCLPRPPPSCRGLWSPWSLLPGADSNQPHAYDLIQDARVRKCQCPWGTLPSSPASPHSHLGSTTGLRPGELCTGAQSPAPGVWGSPLQADSREGLLYKIKDSFFQMDRRKSSCEENRRSLDLLKVMPSRSLVNLSTYLGRKVNHWQLLTRMTWPNIVVIKP